MNPSKAMVGKRVLVSAGSSPTCTDAVEVRILEFSPTGRWVKLSNLTSGNEYWKLAEKTFVIEVLRK